MKIGMLGVGSAGLRHLHALRAIDGVDVVAISRRRNWRVLKLLLNARRNAAVELALDSLQMLINIGRIF